MKHVLLTSLLIFLPVLASAETVEIDGIWYNLVPKAKEAEVTKNPNKYSGNVEIPVSVTYNDIQYSVTSIGNSAFKECHLLTSVTIGNSVISIGERAFSDCTSLTSATIPNSVTSIGINTFKGCKVLTSVTIGNSVPSIGSSAFDGCLSLTSISIPNSVISIGNYAFRDCRSLTTVNIGNSVTSIGYFAFDGCTSLNSVHISDIGVWCKITFKGKESNPLYVAHRLYLNEDEITDLVIPNSVMTISEYSFFECNKLTSVNIPSNVTSIGSSAFEKCSGLSTVNIGNGVISLSKAAFRGCSGLTSVTIPNSVTSIGNSAFEGCSGLSSVNIGRGVRSIEEKAFAKCEELTDIYCLAEKNSSESWTGIDLYTNSDAFWGSYPQAMTLHVPAASIEAYRSTEPWNQFKAIVALEEGDNPEIKKCATPEISYVNGKVSLSCETEGVEFISEVTVADAKKYYDPEFTLSQTYKITVYATKAGYENSDVATREIIIENGQTSLFGDLNKDGKVNVADHVKLSSIILDK